jgi:RimK-like ATP-grasp domain
MIFLCGIPSEPSLGLVASQLETMDVPHVTFHQRRFAEMDVEFQIAAGQVTGQMRFGADTFRLEDFTAVFTRLMDYRLLPEVENLPHDAPERLHCHQVHAAIMHWYEIAPGRVMNRRSEVDSSFSKPLQTQLIQDCGFATPDTVVTNDPDIVRQFKRDHGRVIYKSTSYIRSIVSLLEDDDMARLFSLNACPVQFQEFIEGDNLRVHTVGQHVHATRISSSTVDYRYSYLEDQVERLEAVEISDDLAAKCLALAATFGLEFAGIDLKLATNGEVHCLEVNSSPAFSYYQLHTGQAISRSVAELLAKAA